MNLDNARQGQDEEHAVIDIAAKVKQILDGQYNGVNYTEDVARIFAKAVKEAAVEVWGGGQVGRDVARHLTSQIAKNLEN